MTAKLNSPVCAPEQNCADSLENKIRQPDDEMRRKFGSRGERFAENDEAVINQHEAERDGHADIRFAAMHADAQRNADERKAKTGERKGELPVHFHAHWLGQIFSLPGGFTKLRAQLSRVG